MANQKYCRNCGAPNIPEAKFCANCSNAFDSAAASSSAAPLAASMPWEQQPPYSPSSGRTIFGISRKWVIIGIVALFVILTLGCVVVAMTSDTATPTPTAVAGTTTATKTPTAAPTSSSDQSSYITSQFSKDYTIVTPFSKSTNSYGNVVYTGVVKDSPEKKLNPYQHKITIELTKNNDTTKARYEQYKTQLLSSGLVKEFDYGDYMTFYDGSTYTNPPRQAFLDMNEPGLINHIYNTGVFLNLGNTFMVTLDDTTKL